MYRQSRIVSFISLLVEIFRLHSLVICGKQTTIHEKKVDLPTPYLTFYSSDCVAASQSEASHFWHWTMDMISGYTIRLRWLLRNALKTAFDSPFVGFVLLAIVRASGRVQGHIAWTLRMLCLPGWCEAMWFVSALGLRNIHKALRHYFKQSGSLFT